MLKQLSLGLSLMLAGALCYSQGNDKEWQVSLAGGQGSSSNPANDGETGIDIDNKSIVHLTLHRKEKQNDDKANLYYEFLYSRTTLEAAGEGNMGERRDIDAQHLHVGGTYEWTNSKWVRPYFSLGIGASHYEPDVASSDTYFSSSAALGSRVWITSSVALTLEARAIGTALSSETGIFCPNAECTAGVDASVWWQRHYTAGVTWAF